MFMSVNYLFENYCTEFFDGHVFSLTAETVAGCNLSSLTFNHISQLPQCEYDVTKKKQIKERKNKRQ